MKKVKMYISHREEHDVYFISDNKLSIKSKGRREIMVNMWASKEVNNRDITREFLEQLIVNEFFNQ